MKSKPKSIATCTLYFYFIEKKNGLFFKCEFSLSQTNIIVKGFLSTILIIIEFDVLLAELVFYLINLLFTISFHVAIII